ncbi:MAG: ABC transporter permease, partial [Chitinophagaceae bacterium]
MNFLFAWRYFKSKKSTNAINIISWISVLAIAVVTAALIIVFSVFNGFEDIVKSLYADFYADIHVAAKNGKIISLTPQQIQQIKRVEDVAAISLSIEDKASLQNDAFQTIVYLRGVDSNQALVNKVNTHIVNGTYNLGDASTPNLVIGVGIESALNIDAANNIYPITMYLPNKQSSNLISVDGMNAYNVHTSGAFMVQPEFDNKYVFANIDFLRYMLNLKPYEYSFCDIELKDEHATNKVVKQLQQLLGEKYTIETRYQQNKSLYTAMQIEKWVIYGVTCLILAIAAFNIIGALTMLVLEKQKDIAVLSAMGASKELIKNIFLSTGVFLAVLGASIGIFLATIICLLQIQFHFIVLQGGSFLIDYYPVKLLLSDYVIVVITVLLIAL